MFAVIPFFALLTIDGRGGNEGDKQGLSPLLTDAGMGYGTAKGLYGLSSSGSDFPARFFLSSTQHAAPDRSCAAAQCWQVFAEPQYWKLTPRKVQLSLVGRVTE